jgi:Ger(x)C family germination protein
MGRSFKLRWIAVCLSMLLTIPAGGCWDNKDINHRSLPIVMGIAKRDGIYKVVLQVPEPTEGTTDLRVIEGKGTTINDIVDKISTNMESQIDLLHLKLILFEDEFAKEGLGDVIESFMRAHDISAKVMVAICDEPLESFFKNINTFHKNNGTVLLSFFEKNAGWNPQVAQSSIWEVFRSMNSYTHDVSIPIIRSGTGTVIESRGSAIIGGGRMVGNLTPGETLIVNAFKGSSAQGKIEVMKNATVEIMSSATVHRHTMKNGIPYLKSKFRLKVTLLETKGSPSQESIRQEVNKLLQNRYDSIIGKMKVTQADILATGQYFRSNLTRDQLEHWREDYLPRLNCEVEFVTVIQNTGLLRDS